MKSKKQMNFIIPLYVYPFDIMFSFGQTDEELFEVTGQKDLDEEQLSMFRYADNGIAKYIMLSSGASIIRMKQVPRSVVELGFLQHEIFHFVTILLDELGMKLVIGVSDEAYAYLVGYISTEVLKRIRQ